MFIFFFASGDVGEAVLWVVEIDGVVRRSIVSTQCGLGVCIERGWLASTDMGSGHRLNISVGDLQRYSTA